MCVVAEQVVNHNVPVDAVRDIEDDVLGFGWSNDRPARDANTYRDRGQNVLKKWPRMRTPHPTI
jgi:hypothetical protein